MSSEAAPSIRKAYHDALVILMVEDHMVFCKEARHALPQHQVLFARTVEEAKERYREHLPNITFLDIDLPDGDGFTLLDEIRAQDPDAYIVILTGSKLEEDISTSQKKGANGYLIKPFTRSKLEQHIQEYETSREQTIKGLLAETEQHRKAAQGGE